LYFRPFSSAFDSSGRILSPFVSTPFAGATLFSPALATGLPPTALGGGFAGAGFTWIASLIPKYNTNKYEKYFLTFSHVEVAIKTATTRLQSFPLSSAGRKGVSDHPAQDLQSTRGRINFLFRKCASRVGMACLFFGASEECDALAREKKILSEEVSFNIHACPCVRGLIALDVLLSIEHHVWWQIEGH
jgi:hypothetical protein